VSRFILNKSTRKAASWTKRKQEEEKFAIRTIIISMRHSWKIIRRHLGNTTMKEGKRKSIIVIHSDIIVHREQVKIWKDEVKRTLNA